MNFFLNNTLISLDTAQYIPYDNRKAYFDNLKHFVEVIKQLTFCSIITSANKGGW